METQVARGWKRPLGWLVLGAAAVAACTMSGSGNTPPPPAGWSPGTVYRTSSAPNARGLVDQRGLVHAHSIFSHDACDGMPVDDAGMRNMPCFEDFRTDLCRAGHDFVFLTDHGTLFNDTEFPDTLLYSAQRGDVLLTEDGEPTANRAACPDGTHAIIMAGSENAYMPVGLRHHVAPPGARGAVMGSQGQQNIDTLKQNGAVMLVAHTEDWTPESLTNVTLDGFEMFNLHASTLSNAGNALILLNDLLQQVPDMIHPDLAVLTLISEDNRYLSTWGTVLARGFRRVTTMGSDCHRNTFQQKLADGERADSYRRMMMAFSNHLLVRPATDGSISRVELVEALGAARLYGVFEVLGYAEGFDFTATQGTTVLEMGSEVMLSAGPVTLTARMPRVQNLDPRATPPELTLRVLRAREGGFDEVARGPSDVTLPVTQPGAYRVEVRMRPRHLREQLGYDRDRLAEEDRPWVYSNAIHVR